MKRKATAQWQGGLKDGQGTVSTESGVLKDSRYNFAGRFEDGAGTNPEELIGAAHAGCYSMALSLVLGEEGYTPERINTDATVSIEPDGDGFSITGVHLDMNAKIPGIEEDAFRKIANAAKEGCLVSKALSTKITLEATLES